MVSYLDQRGVEYLVDKIRDLIYPVNSLYISTSATSPASYFGGSWERYGTGRALISASDTDTDFKAGKTGGSKTHYHEKGTLGAFVSLDGTNIVVKRSDAPDFLGDVIFNQDVRGGSYNATFGADTFGHTANASSLQPYIAVYIWRRTA